MVLRALYFVWVLMAVAVDTKDISAQPGIPQQAIDDFMNQVDMIGHTMIRSWEETITFPQLAISYLTVSKTFPDRQEYETFIGSNKYWNPQGTIWLTQWVPAVENSKRSEFEAQAQSQFSGFRIFSFTSTGPTPRPQNYSNYYFPIFYISPPADPYIGLDLNDDIEGPAIWAAMSTGLPATAEPFEARGPGMPALKGYKKLMGLYMPLYHLNSSLTIVRNPNFAGCLVTIIGFHPMVVSLLAELNLGNIDVFLFWIKYGADGSNTSTYVGHFESDPEATKPHITPENASALQPADIDGDIVTNFVRSFDLKLFDKTFRYMVRARKGSIVKDVLIFGARCAPCDDTG